MPRGTPKEIALKLRRRANALEQSVKDAEKRSAEEALKLARFYSSGPYTLSRLASLGHPYASRRPRPPQDAAIINYHAGVFYRGWKIRGPRKSGTGLVTTLFNDSPVARFLLKGTRFMIARPIIRRIRDRLKDTRRRLISQALKKAGS